MERRTLLLAGAFLCLAGAFYLVEIRGGRARARARQIEAALFPIAGADVSEVGVSGGARLAARGGAFHLAPESGVPSDAPTDTIAARELVGRLLAARWERRLALPSDSLAAFGLDPPRAWGTARARDGREWTIDLGGPGPTGSTLYARVRGANRFGLVWSSVLRDFETDAVSMRDRRVVVGAIADVESIRVERPSGTLTLARGPERAWRLEAPVEGRASNGAVAAWLEALRAIRARAFLDSLGADRAAIAESLGPRARRVALAGGGPAEELIVSGAPTPEGRVLALASFPPRPVLVDGQILDDLDVSPDSLLEDRLFRHFTDEAIAFQLARGRDTLEAERVSDRSGETDRPGGAWRIVRPDTLDADPVRVRAFLRNLDAIRVAGRARGVTAVEAGLDAPRAVVRLRFETAPLREGILVGGPAPRVGDYATIEGEPGETLVLPERVLGILTPDPAAYEDSRPLAASVPLARSLEISIAGAPAARLTRASDGAWRGRAGGSPLPAEGASRVAASLAALEILDRIPAIASDSALGFAAPVLVAEWDGPRAGRLEIGGALDPTRQFARLSGRRAIAVVGRSVVDSLRALLGDGR